MSLSPRGSNMLFDLADDMKLASGAIALDVYGQAAYDMMLDDCLWHVYAMIGKLVRRVYLLSAPAEMDGPHPGRATVEP